jgi:adenylosuccinate synthase
MDALKERNLPEGSKIGTTKRGIGPAYADKASRTGIRAYEMLDQKRFEKRFREEAEKYNTLFENAGAEPLDIDAEWEKLKKAAEYLNPRIQDTVLSVNRAVAENKNILFEGAQGALLDIDHGTYPFVTSSNTTSGGACTGSGLPPKAVDEVYGVMKAYTTRVGEGPFPTELHCKTGKALRKAGNEFGATTGRPRRCGWFDAVASKYSCMINGTGKLAVTKLDVLDKLPEIKICTAYDVDGRITEDMPVDPVELEKAKPVYESMPGWQQDTSGARSFDDLPEKAQKYIHRITELVNTKADIISVGPKREQTFYL